MTERPMGERVTAVEVSLRQHIESCEKKHNRVFAVQLTVLAAVLGMVAKMFGFV